MNAYNSAPYMLLAPNNCRISKLLADLFTISGNRDKSQSHCLRLSRQNIWVTALVCFSAITFDNAETMLKWQWRLDCCG